MTASEKLKKLEARLSPGGLAGLVETVDSYEALKELGVALPQIVAAIEAAERLDDSLQTDPWHKLDAALAALDEALT